MNGIDPAQKKFKILRRVANIGFNLLRVCNVKKLGKTS